MAITARDNSAVRLLKSLGVNTSKATKCIITFEPDSIVTMRIDYRLENGDIETLLKSLKVTEGQ